MSSNFILGDPRFLAGGLAGVSSDTYESSRPSVVPDGSPTVGNPSCASQHTVDACANNGQIIHRGIGNYHSGHGASHNVFLVPGDTMPSAGVEIETVFHDDQSLPRAYEALKSNWFHFERDGSLPSMGHELITEPLPSRVYRDLDVWLGLQNLMSPFASSYKYNQTGLHVHVGTAMFRHLDSGGPLSRFDADNRAALARLVLATVYYGACGKDLLDSVFLRKASNYCLPRVPATMAPAIEALARTEVPFADLVDMVVASLASSSSSAYSCLSGGGGIISCTGKDNEFCGHGAELNFSHRQTVEFRRGNGTLNGASVHRMVEFCSLLVSYVRTVATTDGSSVSREGLYSYIKQTTVSESLKDSIERCEKKGSK